MPGQAGHFLKNFLLLSLTLAILPISTVVVFLFSVFTPHQRREQPWRSGRKTILVNGVGMAKGLTIARLLHLQGHRVIGADCNYLSPGRASRAIDAFYVLPRPTFPCSGPSSDEKGSRGGDPYIQRLAQIVELEEVDLWISVSDVSAALHDAKAGELIELGTKARAIQLREKDIEVLHSKTKFIDLARSLGLLVPDTRTVTDKASLLEFFATRGGLVLRPGGAQYLVKPAGVDDVARFGMPILPLDSAEQTLEQINSIPFGRDVEFVVQEFIHGEEYCTHALVVRGRVRAFVACPSSGVLMHYAALKSESPLNKKMLHFTETVVASGGDMWTGHVSFDFLVKPSGHSQQQSTEDIEIFPIECNPRVHTAVVLLGNTPGMADEYLNALDPAPTAASTPLSARGDPRYFWNGQDLVEESLLPTLNLARGAVSLDDWVSTIQGFVHRMSTWKDGTFEAWDPWPWWWLYHVHWPVQFAKHMFTGRWAKINVSTGKIFDAR